MKIKSHSGLKKRLKIKKSGMAVFNKAGKKHLLVNKSKRQKKAMHFGVPLAPGTMRAARKLMPGLVKRHTTRQQYAARKAQAEAK